MTSSPVSPSLVAPSSPFLLPSHDSHPFSRRLSSNSLAPILARKPSPTAVAHALVPRSSSNSLGSGSDPSASPATSRRIQIRIGHFEKAKKELALEKEKLTQDEWEEVYSISQIQVRFLSFFRSSFLLLLHLFALFLCLLVAYFFFSCFLSCFFSLFLPFPSACSMISSVMLHVLTRLDSTSDQTRSSSRKALSIASGTESSRAKSESKSQQ